MGKIIDFNERANKKAAETIYECLASIDADKMQKECKKHFFEQQNLLNYKFADENRKSELLLGEIGTVLNTIQSETDNERFIWNINYLFLLIQELASVIEKNFGGVEQVIDEHTIHPGVEQLPSLDLWFKEMDSLYEYTTASLKSNKKEHFVNGATSMFISIVFHSPI